MTITTSKEKPLLDKSWQRVISFDEAGPSKQRKSNETHQNGEQRMELDEAESEGGEWEFEEEEELITLDLGPDSKRLVQMSREYSIAGLETPTPYLQLGNLMFKGTWDKLIGTEIILQDEKFPFKPKSQQHNLWPLPATETDRKLGRPPSTTRKRILFKQADNLAEKESTLIPAENVQKPAVWRQAPGLSEAKTGLISEKGWLWVRGKGWMRREETILLRSKAGQSKSAKKRQNETREDQEEKEDDDQNQEGVDDEEEDEDDIPLAELSKRAQEQQEQSTVKRGRPPMTPEEKIRSALYRQLRNVQIVRKGGVIKNPVRRGKAKQTEEEGEGEEGEDEDEDQVEEDLQEQEDQ